MTRRVASRGIWAAAIGAFCGAGWIASLQLAGKFTCSGELECVVPVHLLAPASALAWTGAAWGLLRFAALPRAGINAAVGTVCSFPLMFISGQVLGALHLDLPGDGGILVIAVAGAGGYALAAVVTAGYGGRRDRTEHRGQDG